jgi:hypothetical protein
MKNPEIEAIGELVKAPPGPAVLAERRDRLDALGTRYILAPDRGALTLTTWPPRGP